MEGTDGTDPRKLSKANMCRPRLAISSLGLDDERAAYDDPLPAGIPVAELAPPANPSHQNPHISSCVVCPQSRMPCPADTSSTAHMQRSLAEFPTHECS